MNQRGGNPSHNTFTMDFKKTLLSRKNINLITEDWNGEHYDFEIGNESSADGYDLWYFKAKKDNFDICENVYYYQEGVVEAVEEFILNHTDEPITIVDFTDDGRISELVESSNEMAF